VAEALDASPGASAELVAGSVAPPARGMTLLARPDVAAEQLSAEREFTGADDDGDGPEGADGPEVGPPPLRRSYGLVSADPERPGRDAGRTGQEILAHLNALVGTDVEVTIEVRATNEDGLTTPSYRSSARNAAALGSESHGSCSS
jgi:hypothetical protein